MTIFMVGFYFNLLSERNDVDNQSLGQCEIISVYERLWVRPGTVRARDHSGIHVCHVHRQYRYGSVEVG